MITIVQIELEIERLGGRKIVSLSKLSAILFHSPSNEYNIRADYSSRTHDYQGRRSWLPDEVM